MLRRINVDVVMEFALQECEGQFRVFTSISTCLQFPDLQIRIGPQSYMSNYHYVN